MSFIIECYYVEKIVRSYEGEHMAYNGYEIFLNHRKFRKETSWLRVLVSSRF